MCGWFGMAADTEFRARSQESVDRKFSSKGICPLLIFLRRDSKTNNNTDTEYPCVQTTRLCSGELELQPYTGIT